jgi:amino acid adenylation domain-containing protein
MLPRPPADAEQWHRLDDALGANFRRIASVFAARPALVGSWTANYGQLCATADRIAQALAAAGPPMGGGEPEGVALLMRHDTPLIAAFLGTLCSGRMVAVLNPTDPPARLGQVIVDFQPRVILTEASHHAQASEIAPAGCRVVCADDLLQNDTPPPPPGRTPDLPEVPAGQAAFLMYTSGSTGRPKGVIQTHRNMLHIVHRLSRGMRIVSADQVALFSPLSGNNGIGTAMLALLNGATLHPFGAMERGALPLDQWLDEHRISIWVSTVSFFRNCVKVLEPGRQFPHLRILRVGGESVTPADFAAFQRHTTGACLFMQTMGCTETGNLTQQFYTREDAITGEVLPLGTVSEDVEILLFDETGAPVPDGQNGEIVVRSRYLSPGYWHNESLTARCFSDAGDGFRLYRTGDLGRRTPAGLIHLGRSDSQVKIHGYRVETAEIERHLERLPAVERAVVWAGRTPDDDVQLAACVVLRKGDVRAGVTTVTLRAALRQTLRPAMIPVSITIVDAFPLNSLGKVDLARLRQLPIPSPCGQDPPVTATELLLAEIWKRIFHGAAIGRHADFFALGGDSLSAAVVAARLHAARGIALDLSAMADHPTLAALAAHVDTLRTTPPAASPITRVPRDHDIPLSYTQERIWRLCQSSATATGYTMSHAYCIRGALDPECLRECVNHLLRRHDILRTTFHAGPGGPVQRIHPAQPLALPVLDLAGQDDPRRAAQALLAAESARPFDLTRLPLVRFFLARTAPGEHHLLRVNHHLIADAWSWRTFFAELAALYEARREGRPPPLPDAAPLGYADYAAWQRRTLGRDGPAYRHSLDWWAAMFQRPATPLALPFARRRPDRHADMSQGLTPFVLQPPLLQRLDALARAQGVTGFMVRLAALAMLLSRHSGQRDLTLGTYVTHRRHVATQSMLGDFANLATLRLTVDPAWPLQAMLQAARRTVTDMQAHCEIPYEQLRTDLRARRPSVRLPDISAIISPAERISRLHFADLELSWIERVGTAPWGFTLELDSSIQGNRSQATFDPRLHAPARVRDFIVQYAALLEEITR